MDRLRRSLSAVVDWLGTPRGAFALRSTMLIAVLGAGALDTWFYRQWNANPDGVSYIDMARAFAARGFPELVNAYWSPLYPAVLGVGLKLFAPGPDWLYPMVRLIGFAIYVVATFSFARLLRVVIARADDFAGAPTWIPSVFLAAAWSLYFLMVTQATGLHLVTPDIGVAAIVFFAAAELLELQVAAWPVKRWVRLGLLLAIGYWWKAILFPVGGVILLIAAWVAWRRRDARAGPGAGAVTFALAALVVVVPVSRSAGRLTFGETGRVNQLWYVSNVPMITARCLTADGRLAREDLGVIVRDSVLSTRPMTCAMSSRVPEASLPMWYDPAPFYAGVRNRLDARETMVAARNDVRYLVDALREWLPATAIAFGLVLLGSAAARARPVGGAPLVAFCVVPIVAYIIVYVELRHVVPFLAPLGLLALAGLARHGAPWTRGLVGLAALTAVAESAQRVATQQRVEAAIVLHQFTGTDRKEQLTAIAARELSSRGLVAGDAVATINSMWNAEWAQRIGLVVRAYVPEITYPIDRTFAELRDACTRAAFFDTLRAANIKAVVLRDAPGFDAPPEFDRLGETPFRAHLIGAAAERPTTCTEAK